MAAASGGLLALSFPGFGHAAFAWIALAPLLTALARPPAGSLSRGWLLGLLTGAIYFAGTLYWVTAVMAVHGGLALWVAVLLNIGFVAVMALFPAMFAVVVQRLCIAAGPRALTAAPFVWVASELGRTYLFSGFPWVLLGYSQTDVLPVAQLASVFGVYGVSALVVTMSAALAVSGVSIGNPAETQSRGRAARTGPVAIAAGLVLSVAAWGSLRVAGSPLTSSGPPVRVGLVQGNVAQGEKWDPARATAIFERYLGLTRRAIGDGADLIIWPESSTPFSFEDDPTAAEAVRQLARDGQVDILLGSTQTERGSATRYFNAAYLLGADGAERGVYRKRHLVPFGEYVPLKPLLFFAEPLVEAVSEFSPGTEATPLPTRWGPASTAICYEIVFPNMVRQTVAGGSQLLTTITNDAWFGHTAAPHQHFAQAAMRAIENGRYLVRAANTGISGIVDPYGRVLAQSDLFAEAVVVGDIRFLRESTVYTRIGDAFAYASLVLTVGAVLLISGKPRRRPRSRSPKAK